MYLISPVPDEFLNTFWLSEHLVSQTWTLRLYVAIVIQVFKYGALGGKLHRPRHEMHIKKIVKIAHFMIFFAVQIAGNNN